MKRHSRREVLVGGAATLAALATSRAGWVGASSRPEVTVYKGPT